MTNIYSPIKIPDCCGNIELKVLKLSENAIVPSRANESDAGYDLYALEDTIIPSRNRAMVKTGIAIAIPFNHVGLIWPRSGLALKAGLDVLAGVIDSGYRGEVCVILQNHVNEHYHIKSGDRIAQLLIQKVSSPDIKIVSELNESDRGTGGFGSSGK